MGQCCISILFWCAKLERVYDSLNKAQSSINQIISDNRMLGVTVKEVIDKNSDCKNIKPFALDTPVGDIAKGAKDREKLSICFYSKRYDKSYASSWASFYG